MAAAVLGGMREMSVPWLASGKKLENKVPLARRLCTWPEESRPLGPKSSLARSSW